MEWRSWALACAVAGQAEKAEPCWVSPRDPWRVWKVARSCRILLLAMRRSFEEVLRANPWTAAIALTTVRHAPLHYCVPAKHPMFRWIQQSPLNCCTFQQHRM